MKEEMEVINFKGIKNEWFDFICEIKKQRKQVWDVVGPFIRKWTKEARK